MARARTPRRRPPGRPAGTDAPGTRDALLDAASRLFARHGAGEVSLRRIAEEAGCTPAMVHYYFGGRDGLYDALLERTFAGVLARVRTAVEGDDPATDETDDRLGRVLDVLVDTLAAEPWLPTVVVRDVLAEGGRFRERFIEGYASRMAELVPAFVQREIAAGRLRADLDPELGFLSFMGMTFMPFVARPVLERVLALDYDEAFLRRFAAHTRRLFVEGAGS